jgi:ABC-type sugar transport system permease subunit
MGMRMMMVAYVAGIAAIADDAIIAAITDEATKCKCLVYNKRT